MIKKILAIIFILVLSTGIILSYLYLSGKIPTRSGRLVVIYFTDVSGLKAGAPVMVRGIEKGKVKRIELDSSGQSVKVEIILDKDVVLTDDSYFAIRALSYFGTDKLIHLVPGSGVPVTSSQIFWGTNEIINLERAFSKLENSIMIFESIPWDEMKALGKRLAFQIDTVSKELLSYLARSTNDLNLLIARLDTFETLISKEGSIKRLFTSDELYTELLNTSRSMRELLLDIKTNPQKYFTIKIF
jgi:hypothetical protein